MEIILFRDNITNKTHSNFYLEYEHNVSKLLVRYVGTKKYILSKKKEDILYIFLSQLI